MGDGGEAPRLSNVVRGARRSMVRGGGGVMSYRKKKQMDKKKRDGLEFWREFAFGASAGCCAFSGRVLNWIELPQVEFAKN